MAWSTPKTDWGVDAVSSSDLNRIEENTVTLHKGNGQSSLVTVVSAVNLALPNETDETFKVSGSSGPVTYISTTGREPGNRIQLIKVTDLGSIISSAPGSPPGGYAGIYLYKWGTGFLTSSQSWNPNVALTLVYDGTAWYCMV